MWKEFKEFAMKGNIIDLAVGVIIGGAFQKIVSSLVNDIVMPVISIFAGKIDFSTLAINVGNTSIKFGAFLTAIIDFLLMALSIFLIIRYISRLNQKLEKMTSKGMNKLKKKKMFERFDKKPSEEPLPTTKICPFCYQEINIKATRCPHCTSEQKAFTETK